MLAIVSCERDRERGCHDAIRETYLRDIKTPHIFFMGRGSKPSLTDEVALDVGDTYQELWRKSNAILEWAMRHGIDNVFMCDVDTYVRVPRMIDVCSGSDYAGWLCKNEQHAGQGHGIWFGREAVRILIENPCTKGGYWDLYAGGLLRSKGVELQHSPLFLPKMPEPGEDMITAHLGRGTGNWNPQWMRDCHAIVSHEPVYTDLR